MYLLIIVLGLFSLPEAAPDTSVAVQGEKQAQVYINNIESGRNPYPNLWALSVLSKSDKAFNKYISTYLSNSRFNKQIYDHFRDTSLTHHQLLKNITFDTGSPQLLIAALLSTNNKEERKRTVDQFAKEFELGPSQGINYRNIVDTIISGGKISPDLIPANQALFLHFLFLYEGTAHLGGEYYNEFTTHWNNNGLASNSNSFNYSLYKASLVRANFILDLHQENLELYEYLVNDKILPISSSRLSLYRAAFYSLYRLGYYDKGLVLIRNYILPLTKFFNRKDIELNALMNQAISLYNIGKIKESQRINLQVLKEAESKNVSISKSRLYNNLGISYWKTGEFNQYLEWQFKSLDIAEKENNNTHQLSILKNLYVYFRNFKKKDEALFYLNKAKKLALDIDSNQELAKIFISEGVFHREFNKNFEKALQAYNKADSLINANTDYSLAKNLLYEKAKLYEHFQGYQKALAKHQEIQELTSEKENTSSYVEALVDQARIHLKLNQLNSVKELVDKIQSESLDQSTFIQVVKAKTVEANYLSRTDKYEQAYKILQPVIEQVIHRAKASTSVESGFWNIEPEYLEAFDVMIRLLLQTDRNEEAIETLDQLKTINDPALYQNPMVKSSLLNEAELTQYQRLTNELDALRRQQLVASEDRKPIIKRRIDRLNVQKQALDQKISKLTTTQSVSLNDIQHKLTGSEVVLHITELNDWFYIGRITKRNTEISKVRLDSTNRSLFKSAITNLSNGKTNLKQLYEISTLLKLGELPEWITTITIVPDSYLFELPIDILPLEQPTEEYSYGGATYLVERFNTHYVTSINDFIVDSKSTSEHAFDFAGYGLSTFDDNENKNLVPLPFATSEVQTIAANLTNLKNRKTFVDIESTESAFKASAPRARILHLATHSEISDQDPLYSTIYMSSESENADTDFRGQIFAYELFELNLNNEMIMLNSCESGSGSYLQGTGIMGISRALRYAGAKSLVLNLWSVNDMMASEFAIKFYEYLNQGKSKTEALQLTKVHFIKEKNANPHFWGPYMLIGEKSPIIEPYEKANFYFAASFMLYFVLFVAFSLFKRQSQ